MVRVAGREIVHYLGLPASVVVDGRARKERGRGDAHGNRADVTRVSWAGGGAWPWALGLGGAGAAASLKGLFS